MVAIQTKCYLIRKGCLNSAGHHFRRLLWLHLDEGLTRGIAMASVMFNPSFMFNVCCEFLLDHK